MTAIETEAFPIERLEWDSLHFGFEVYSVRDPRAQEEVLRTALEECHRLGATLAYWAADRGRTPKASTLERFGGDLVDVKTTYGRTLDPEGGGERISGTYRFLRSTGPPCHELVQLALAAGEFSRFRVDRRMPRGVFQDLYEEWIRRSCSGEIADAVIEAHSPAGTLDGMVTVAIDGRVGSIGLIAVDARARGRGLGRALIRKAELFMRANGAEKATVVTQGENRAACGLYEGCGYEVRAVANMHHFWLR